MNTIKTYIETLAGQLVSDLSFIDSVQWIGRQDPTGVIIGDDESYSGLDDTQDSTCYIRRLGDYDADYDRENKLKTFSENKLRLVYMGKCSNVEEVREAVVSVMLGSFDGFGVRPSRSTTNKQFIFEEETKKEKTTDTIWSFVAVDFTLTYRLGAQTSSDCYPDCDEC